MTEKKEASYPARTFHKLDTWTPASAGVSEYGYGNGLA